MHWIHLIHEDQLQKIIVRSEEKPQVVFKYSSHCHLSEAIFTQLQKNCCPDHMDFHFLDLTDHENISNKILGKISCHSSISANIIDQRRCMYLPGKPFRNFFKRNY